jgi:linoleoyl-CoA desaturase
MASKATNAAGPKTQADTTPTMKRLSFAADNEFYVELKRRVDQHMTNNGRRERDCPQMYLKTAIILTTFVTSYVLLVFASSTWWQAFPLAVVLAFATAAIGFNIMHDASHHAYSNKGWVNRLAVKSLDLIGGSSYLWHWKHVVFHHTYTNIYNYDTDIDLGELGRLTPHHKRLHIHEFQHWYMWFLYGALVIKWNLFDDFRVAIRGRIGEHRYRPLRGGELATFIVGKVLFFMIAFGVPLLFHSAGIVALFYIFIAFIVGIVLSVVFQLAHAVEEAHFPREQTPGHIDKPWAIHQLETTVDFAPKSRVAYWLLGGLNFQIEHHLFPRICHIHYPFIAPVVEETCQEFGVSYNVVGSFRQGVMSHFRWLRRMGARDEAEITR